MPFLSHQLLHYLTSLAPEQDVVIPRLEGLLEPLHAVYSKACLTVIEELLSQGRLSILEVFPRVRVRDVGKEEINRFDPSLHSFVNLNTPDELLRAQQITGRGPACRARCQQEAILNPSPMSISGRSV